jgi:magnesium transporter
MPRRKTAQRVKRGSTEWINLTRPKKSDLQALGKKFKLSKDHLEALTTDGHRSRLFDSENYLLLILIHPSFDEDTNDVKLKELDILVTNSQVVTMQMSSMPIIKNLLKKVSSERSSKSMAHTSTMVMTIIHELITDVYGTLGSIAEKLDEMEQGILKKKRVLEDILVMETNIMLDRYVAALTKSSAAKVKSQHSDLQRHLSEIKTSLRMEQMTAETLHRTHETVLNYRTNSQIRLLTSLSLIVLPATLLAGIFGMNVSFPYVGNVPINFAMIISLMTFCGLTVWLIGKTRK